MAQKKLKPILPSLREKKRYIVFEVISKNRIANYNAIFNSFMNSILQFLGELGTAKAGPIILEDKYNPKTQKGLIKVNNKYINHIKSALILINSIENQEVIVKSIGISGILKKAEKKYLLV